MDKELLHWIWNSGLTMAIGYFGKIHFDNRRRRSELEEKRERLDEKTDERLRNLEINSWKKEDHNEFEKKMLLAFDEIKSSLKDNANIFNTAIKELGHELNNSVKELSVNIAQIEARRKR